MRIASGKPASLFVPGRELTVEPQPGGLPFACDGTFREIEGRGDLSSGQSAEEFHLDDLSLFRVEGGEAVERLVEGDGATANVGAVTFCSGLTGCAPGPVSTTSSLTGVAANDSIGSTSGDNHQPNGAITALPNGSYTVSTYNYQSSRGAVTFCNASTGCTGMNVTAANSWLGSTSGQFFGQNGVTALTNGSYVVQSSSWDVPSFTNAGAVTICTDAVAGCIGTASTAASFTGTSLSDEVGEYVTALPNGNFVIASPIWNGTSGAADRGAVTLCTPAGCASGSVSAANSMVGTTLNDRIGSSQNEVGSIFQRVLPHPDGSFSFLSADWNNGALNDSGAVTYVPASGAAGTLSSANSVFGLVADAGDTLTSAFDPVHGQLVVGRPAENIVTLFRPDDAAPGPTPTPNPTATPTATPVPTPANCSWSPDTAMSSPVVAGASASVGGVLYSFGGVSGGTTTANAYKFDGKRGRP